MVTVVSEGRDPRWKERRMEDKSRPTLAEAAGTRTSGVENEQRLGGWAKGKRGGGGGGGPGKKRDRRGRKQRTGHRFQAGRPPHSSNHVAAPTEKIVLHTIYIFYLKFLISGQICSLNIIILQLLRVVYKNSFKMWITYFNDFAKWKFWGWRLSQMLEKTFSKPSGTKSTPIKYTSG
ncbi:hypothetical protein ALC56_08677 [Trachymyrmex septentrionalis]|uniref:Uncharacterized protein n=1 Tax=Trachymyrmex septentrionalis TaxID=34720 RepID=A0A195F929_9HYME|nr:hypothetical protein ALC56_08677 [Trachymyrmex septentrionalis]